MVRVMIRFKNQCAVSFKCSRDDVEMVVILVNHNEIIENKNKLEDRLVLDTKNIMEKSDKVYKL